MICQVCAAYGVSRRRRVRAVVVGASLIAVIAAITSFLVTLPKSPAPRARSSEPDTIVRFQRERLEATPCEPKTSINLVERLMELTRWQDAKRAAEASIERCGVIGRMRWRLAHIDQQLHLWEDTTKVTSQLIEDDPEDSDFWWWRAEAWADGNHPLSALADYRQSLALTSSAQGGQFAANRFLTAAKAAGELCEAARAWRMYVQQLGGRPSQEMRDETAALVRSKACVAEHGTGHMALAASVRVTLEGATGVFRVDPQLGTTLVSRMFAARAGLVPSSTERAQAQSLGQIYGGEPMQVTLRAGSALASRVDVLVTDDLPGDAAGVLGLSFLWHFSVRETDAGVVLSPPVDERSE